MGVFIKTICIHCGIEKSIFQNDGHSINQICDECNERIERKRKNKHFKKLSKMTLEDRIKRIELILYNNDI